MACLLNLRISRTRPCPRANFHTEGTRGDIADLEGIGETRMHNIEPFFVLLDVFQVLDCLSEKLKSLSRKNKKKIEIEIWSRFRSQIHLTRVHRMRKGGRETLCDEPQFAVGHCSLRNGVIGIEKNFQMLFAWAESLWKVK